MSGVPAVAVGVGGVLAAAAEPVDTTTYPIEYQKRTCDLYDVLDTFAILEKGAEFVESKLAFLSENPVLFQKVKEFMDWDHGRGTRKAVSDMIDNEDAEALSRVLGSRLEFGTAGLRGRMGPGYNAMNDLVIIQTTQGFAKYLETIFSLDDLARRGIIIGYDARHYSQRFAVLAANVFVQRGHHARLFSRICPTPWVPFAVLTFDCCAGIMITASHNPKEDNGYKVYWENGAQIISPHDKGIQNAILENLEPWPDVWNLDKDDVWENRRITCPRREVLERYFNCIAAHGLGHSYDRNRSSSLKITYTPMHGVGNEFMSVAFQMAGLSPFFPVPEQKDPDPDFPTVKFPNPEEGKSALTLAIQTANKKESTLILANDPDADRLAVAEKLPSGEWKIFNGNEIGALLGWWCLENWIMEHSREKLKDAVMISSTVSSKILKSMAEIEGFNFRETLTGFKWMANLAHDLMEDDKAVLFAFEEAIGFMVETYVLDKDGISAGIRVAEMAVKLKEDGLTLVEQLNKIYEKYGYHSSRNSYYLCHVPQTIVSLFDNLRSMGADGKLTSSLQYPTHIANGKYKIVRVRDLTTGFDSGEADNKATLPVSKGSQMITFYFENGLVATLRTSGTEPKIKYYTELCASPSERDWDSLNKTLNEMVDAIIAEWIDPKKWGLLPPDETD